MAKPVLLVTRKLPEAIEARAEPAGRALGDRRGRDRPPRDGGQRRGHPGGCRRSLRFRLHQCLPA